MLSRLLRGLSLLCAVQVGSFPICNPDLDWKSRAIDLVSRMNVNEKIGWLGDQSPAIPRLGIPFYEWWSEALHGVAGSYGGVNFTTGPISSATQFPEPIGMASAFSRELIHTVATAISTEARAMNNVGQAGMTFFTPNINLFRDPRWGRGQETPGEDPYLASEYVFALITGLQGGVDDRYLKIVADCKHFAAYDLENWDNVTRFEFNAVVSDQDLQESLLPSFESCIRDAKVGSIMCSYNALNGVPACGNEFLLQELARDAWGLEGFVVSDCDAVAVIQNPHFYTKTNDDTVALALHSGCDVNCGDYYQTNALSALENLAINETDIDQALVRAIGTLVRTGWFDPAEMQPYRQLPPSVVNSAEHQALAVRAAVEGMVLLKNDPSPLGTFLTLPWSTEGAPTIALIGPLANATSVMQGNYYGQAPYLISPMQALQEAGYTVLYSPGCAVNGTDESGFADALATAAKAKFVLYVGGIDQDFEAEQLDRYSIDLPLIQQKMIAALGESITGANDKPFATAFFAGGPVDYSVAKETNAVGAILWMGYPGQSGGTAMAQILSGAYSPAGRLVTTIYPAAYVDQVSMFDMSFRASSSNPGRTYKFYPADQQVFSFGDGLSYTTFELNWFSQQNPEHQVLDAGLVLERLSIASLHASHVSNHRGAAVTYRVNVTNAGTVVSDTVVLLFTMPDTPDPSLPAKELVGFERVAALQPQQTVQVFFPIQARQLARVNAKGERWLHPGRIVIGLDQPTKKAAIIELTGLAMRLH